MRAIFTKMTACLACMLLLACLCTPALACTSFAVYGPQGVYYGMNWDYPQVPARVRIADAGEEYSRFFALSFEFGGDSVDNAILNDQGLFVSMQDHYPTEPFLPTYDDAYESLPGLAFWTPFVHGDAQGIRTTIAQLEKPLRHMYVSVHHLFADTLGDAVIVEVLDEAVVLTDIDGPYIIMTNFAIDQLREVEAKRALGYGQDRYVIARHLIEESLEAFDVDKAFEVLDATTQSEYTFYPTQYSVVHDPQALTSYFVLRRNFDQVWQVTLEDGMLRTYRGFSAPLEMPLTDEGVPFEVLLEHEKAHRAGT